jgi:hypothetical protein
VSDRVGKFETRWLATAVSLPAHHQMKYPIGNHCSPKNVFRDNCRVFSRKEGQLRLRNVGHVTERKYIVSAFNLFQINKQSLMDELQQQK